MGMRQEQKDTCSFAKGGGRGEKLFAKEGHLKSGGISGQVTYVWCGFDLAFRKNARI